MDNHVDNRKADEGAAHDATDAARTARRRLMLGAAAVLPSVVTLPSGAQTALASNVRCWARDATPDDPPDRYTLVPDGWLRKKVYVGKYHGKDAVCTMWEQGACVDTRKGGRNGAEGTTWYAHPAERIVAGKGFSVDAISESPVAYALVYVDQQGITFSLEPDPANRLRPVREACWSSMIGDRGRGTFLG